MERGGDKVLIVENDAAIAEIVREVLTEAGLVVSVLRDGKAGAIRPVVEQLEPDCILLDGAGASSYGESWADAAWLATRAQPVPTVMFTAHTTESREAQQGQTVRARAAQFAGVLLKPFDLDDLTETVGRALGRISAAGTTA